MWRFELQYQISNSMLNHLKCFYLDTHRTCNSWLALQLFTRACIMFSTTRPSDLFLRVSLPLWLGDLYQCRGTFGSSAFLFSYVKPEGKFLLTGSPQCFTTYKMVKWNVNDLCETHKSFTFMNLAFQYKCSLPREPKTPVLITQCCTNWATGTYI